jgi:hypothetical protein
MVAEGLIENSRPFTGRLCARCRIPENPVECIANRVGGLHIACDDVLNEQLPYLFIGQRMTGSKLPLQCPAQTGVDARAVLVPDRVAIRIECSGLPPHQGQRLTHDFFRSLPVFAISHSRPQIHRAETKVLFQHTRVETSAEN